MVKTKAIVVYFRKKKAPASQVCIHRSDVEIVKPYKYLGVHPDDKLEWSTNTEAIYEKSLSQLYFLRRLRSFSVCNKIFHMSLHTPSTIFCALVC